MRITFVNSEILASFSVSSEVTTSIYKLVEFKSVRVHRFSRHKKFRLAFGSRIHVWLWLILLLIILSGDVELNPGPIDQQSSSQPPRKRLLESSPEKCAPSCYVCNGGFDSGDNLIMICESCGGLAHCDCLKIPRPIATWLKSKGNKSNPHLCFDCHPLLENLRDLRLKIDSFQKRLDDLKNSFNRKFDELAANRPSAIASPIPPPSQPHSNEGLQKFIESQVQDGIERADKKKVAVVFGLPKPHL